MNRMLKIVSPLLRRMNGLWNEWRSLGILLGLACILGSDVLSNVKERNAALDGYWLQKALVYYSSWAVFAALTIFVVSFIHRQRNMLASLGNDFLNYQHQYVERVELALAGADLGLWEWHLSSGSRKLSPRGANMLGVAIDALSSISLFYRQVHPEDLDIVRAALGAHLRGDSSGYEAEFRMRHCRGTWLWVKCRGKVIERNSCGHPLRLLGTRMDISERKASEEKMHQLAYLNGLTMLPNLRSLLQCVNHALVKSKDPKQYAAVLFLNVDRFAHVNISFGYDVGNLLLQSVAQRLQKLFHLNCTIFHIEGDQFVILVQDIAICFNDAFCTVESIGNRILRHLAEPHILDRRVYCCTTRIGVTLFRPEGQSAEAVVQRAELALRQAKVDGAALLRFFDATMQSDIVACTSLEADLRKALLRREFYLHYQPIVDASGDQRGVEALLRWTHPTRGAVRPDEFIAVAEKTGLMLQIGQWVLKHGCRVLAQLAGQASTAHYTVAINVSALQLRQPDFVCMVMSALQSTGAPPDRLKLELTESMLLEDVNQVVEKMRALRDVGVTFYLDDFGTGYSSFSYLKALPLSHLKIDRSFIQDVTRNAGDAAIVRSLITLAKCLGLDVVAEGVETKEQFEFLRDNGCTFFQGYLFGRPAPLPFTGFTPDAS